MANRAKGCWDAAGAAFWEVDEAKVDGLFAKRWQRRNFIF